MTNLKTNFRLALTALLATAIQANITFILEEASEERSERRLGNRKTGYGYFRDDISPLCIELKDGKTDDGTKLIFNKCEEGKAPQLWRFDETTEYGFRGKLHTKVDDGKCVQANRKYRAGSTVRIYDCKDRRHNQQWGFDGDALFPEKKEDYGVYSVRGYDGARKGDRLVLGEEPVSIDFSLDDGDDGSDDADYYGFCGSCEENPCTEEIIAAGKLYHKHCDKKEMFLQCGSEAGICYEMDCAPGTKWSQKEQTCVHWNEEGSWSSSNDDNSESKSSTDSKSSDESSEEEGFCGSCKENPCTAENIAAGKFYHKHCKKNKKFLQCGSKVGMCYEKDCAPGTKWSQEKQTCVHRKKNL